MDSLTNICQMLSGNNIYVPNYQRAYSWDTEFDSRKAIRQVNTFLADLQDYIKSTSSSRYYFGHFLFEEKSETCFGIIDGQQRLTTITIFIAALFSRLKEIRSLSDEEDFAYKSMIKVGHIYHFSTVDYDNQLFKDYVINQIKTDHNGLDTKSKQRIVSAYDFFVKEFAQMDEQQIISLLNAVMNASCTTHIVRNEAEAIQMFIFQNNRGKKPSNLEIIKAQFLYNVHLYSGSEDEKYNLIDEIKNRFEEIYKSISKIEHKIDEDNVLTYTLRIFFNSLWENNAIQRVDEKLASATCCIDFICNFTRKLAACFEQITAFFNSEKEDITYHSLILSGNNGLLFPFIIKALLYRISNSDMQQLATSLESIFIRSHIIGTRADLTSRLNDVFQKFEGDIKPIIGRINWMKKQDGWWGYWNDKEFERSLQGGIRHDLAKILLWKYENYLISEGKNGYAPIRYDAILNPQLEHIAPQTENPESGYCEYDEDFKNQYIDCLGNYLLLSASHNISIGNIPFEKKRETYTQLRQQQEVRDMTEKDHYWDIEKIKTRKKKIVNFLLDIF